MVDARYGRGGTTPARLRAALVGRIVHRGPAAGQAHPARHRRRPDARGPVRHDGRAGGRRQRGARPAALRPGRLQRQVGAGPRHLRGRRPAPAARSAPLRLASSWRPTRSPRARCADRDPARTARRPGHRAGTGARRRRSRRALMDQERLAGVGNLLADEILWRADLAPGSRTPLNDDELPASCTRNCGRRCASWRRRGGSHMGELMEERHDGGRCPRTAPSCGERPWVAAPPTGARSTSTDEVQPRRTSAVGVGSVRQRREPLGDQVDAEDEKDDGHDRGVVGVQPRLGRLEARLRLCPADQCVDARGRRW